MESQRKIRVDYRSGKNISEISRNRGISRPTIRKIIRSKELTDKYVRTVQPYPKLGEYTEKLEKLLRQNKQQRVKQTMLSLYHELRDQGYEGSYSAVNRYAKKWHDRNEEVNVSACVPLYFAPGEAYQFDWSQEWIELAGEMISVKVAHFILCYSNKKFLWVYPNETLEMVIDAHVRAFDFFGGTTSRGIYDNMKTAVTKVLRGKERVWNKTFERLCGHYLVEPTACTPASGWEKGRVERQVEIDRKEFFAPIPKVDSIAELNEILLSRLNYYNSSHKHPSQKNKTIDEVFAEESASLVSAPISFDGYRETNIRVTNTCLARYDRNNYSVQSKCAGKLVQCKSYAAELVFIYEGSEVGRHKRLFSRGAVSYDVKHYLPLLAHKPGALRNGAPFMQMDLPEAIRQVETHLMQYKTGSRDFAIILSNIPLEGIDAVEKACIAAIAAGTISTDVILNILLRLKDNTTPEIDLVIIDIALKHEPKANCSAYDSLLKMGINHGI